MIWVLKDAWHRMCRSPMTSVLAVVALALGTGLATTMFSTINGAILGGLPFEDSEELMFLHYSQRSHSRQSARLTVRDFLDWRAEQSSFESLTAYEVGTINLSDEGYPERYEGARFLPGTLAVLREKPLLGRAFTTSDAAPGAEPVVLLSHEIWRTRYAGNPEIVGRTVRVNGSKTTVIGITAEGFEFPFSQRLWLPLSLDPDRSPRGQGRTLAVFGRLKNGVSRRQAQAEMSAVSRRLAEAFPESNQGLGAVVKPLNEEFIPAGLRNLLLTMLGAVGCVVLIACANVAGLLLARSSTRGRELAIRSALGADRQHVIAQVLAEGCLLSALGASLGLLLGRWGNRLLTVLLEGRPQTPYWLEITIEPRVFAFIVGVTAVVGLAAGMLPAMQASKADVHRLLKDEGRSSSFRLGRFNHVLVIGEIALACVLLIGAGLMTRTIIHLRDVDLGFDGRQIMTARIGLFAESYPTSGSRSRFWAELVESLERTPGVERAALTSSLPAADLDSITYQERGTAPMPGEAHPITRLAVVTPSFFEILGAQPIRGRVFGPQDRAGTAPVVLVNSSFADRHWPGEPAAGRRLRLGGEENAAAPWRTVVGVVPDLFPGDLDEEDQSGLYVPSTQLDRSFMSLVVQARGDPSSIFAVLRQRVLELDPDLPIYWVRTLEEAVAEQNFFYDLFGSIFITFGLVALLLSAVGIYGIVAFAVGSRRQEIGLRMALGARREQIQDMVLRQGLSRLVIGLALGLMAGLVVAELLRGILVGIEPRDPLTFCAVAAFLAVMMLVACFFPARTAMQVDPIEALRHE